MDHMKISAHIQAALNILNRGYFYSQDIDCNVWEFAEEIENLYAAGMTANDLRWLLRKQYVEHRQETTDVNDDQRVFIHVRNEVFCERSCFVLTQEGIAYSSSGFSDALTSSKQTCCPKFENTGLPSSPYWSSKMRELRANGLLIKKFRSLAPNQQIILETFEEEGWPLHILDPLTPTSDLKQTAKRRLNDTVKALNKNHKARILRFSTDGTGEGVRWEWRVDKITDVDAHW